MTDRDRALDLRIEAMRLRELAEITRLDSYKRDALRLEERANDLDPDE